MKIYKLCCRGYCNNSSCIVIAKDIDDAKSISIKELIPEEWTTNVNNIDALELGTAKQSKQRGIYCIHYTTY